MPAPHVFADASGELAALEAAAKEAAAAAAAAGAKGRGGGEGGGEEGGGGGAAAAQEAARLELLKELHVSGPAPAPGARPPARPKALGARGERWQPTAWHAFCAWR